MMMRFLKKLNWVHISLILALPIILALINPNWIFNQLIFDDYIYLGHQLDFPGYVGWFPSNAHYFIERLTLILPGYWIRQVFSPLMANFILHLGVYYLAIFSFYGILQKLFNQRVAIFTTLLFGQYPMIMRATGWDYTDGIGMACLTIGIYWLTQSINTRRQNMYYILSGTMVMLMLGANIFNLLYVPFVAIYWLILTNFRVDLRQWFVMIVCILFGAIIVYSAMALIYYLVTNQLLFSSSIHFLQQSASSWTVDQSGSQYNRINPYWHIFFVLIAIISMWYLLRCVPFLKVKRENALAIVALFSGFFGVIGIVTLLGFAHIRLSFYNTNVAMSAFLALGVIFLLQEQKLSSRQFYFVCIGAFSLPIIPLFVQTFWYTLIEMNTYLYLFYLKMGIFIVFLLIVKSAFIKSYFLIVLVIINSIMIGHIPHISIYHKDRLGYQNLYEQTVQVAQFINERYDNFSLDTFWFWFDGHHPYSRTFSAIASIYLYGWGRVAIFQEGINENLLDPNDAILLTSQDRKLDDFNTVAGLFNNRIQLVIEEEVKIGNIVLLFLDVHVFVGDRIFYYFDSAQSSAVADESGWNGYERFSPTGTFRWTSEPTARLVLDVSNARFDPTQTYRVSFVIAGYLEEDVVNSLRLTVNGVSVPLVRVDNQYVGQISGQYLLNPTLELVFQTDRVSNPFDLGIQDGRKLGVALGELRIERG